MAAHAAAPTRRHAPLSSAGALPVVLGVGYFLYALFIGRSAVPALLAGAVLAVLVFALVRVGGALPRELRAASYGALAGAAIGYLYSLTDASVLTSVGIGLTVGAGTLAAAFYVFYTHEG
ncbi:hypothetical protein [Streptomyces sp. NPDC050504]|uniref:hypothetical protein n=1 Tax=Streptomyces sp. NPDC050504 TaxID=3365618 RepID=UPI003792213D